MTVTNSIKVSPVHRYANGLFMLMLAMGLAVDASNANPAAAIDSTAGLSATIERDIRGVPHIHGQTDADAAFGLGYAQAEDSWAVLEKTIPYYRGTAGRYFGPDAARSDYLVHLLGLWQDIELRYETDIPVATRRHVEAFAAGMNHFARAYPEIVELDDLLPVTGQDIVAGHMLRHLLFYGFEAQIKALSGEQRAHPVGTGPTGAPPLGSNATAIAPSRTEDGSTLLMINSHQPLTGPVAWYEAHISSNEGLDIMGGLFPGTPFAGVGFTKYHGWGATVNKPDLVDIYVLEMNPANDNQYRLDGQWRDLEATDIELDVLIWGFIPWSVSETIYRSAHGPVMKTPHGTYAIRYAGIGELRQIDQWLQMNKARNFEEWQAAIALRYIASFNFVYANADGTVHFIHNALTPARQPGWNWQHYLPGDRSDLIWQDYLAIEDLPSLTNPPSGFVHSANQTPFLITEAPDNLRRDDFSQTAGWQTRITNRAVRGLELLAEYGKVSTAEFNAFKHDVSYSVNFRGIDWLESVIALEPENAEEERALELLANWNLSADKDNREAPLGVCILTLEWRQESAGTPLPTPRQALEDCIDQVLSMADRLDPTWGTISRHGRNGEYWPISGGPDTLRAIYSEPSESSEHLVATAGDGLYYLIEWQADGQQRVQGVHPYGSNMTTPDSPHYLDQAEDFANEVTHDPLFDAAAREQNIIKRYRVAQ